MTPVARGMSEDTLEVGLDAESIRRDFVQKLYLELAKFPEVATPNDHYLALAWTIRDRLLFANAYLGARPIADALARGADIVITGRVADAALFLGPMLHEFGWAADDWSCLAQGVTVGHLLECSGQGGGQFRLGRRVAAHSRSAHIGYPIAEVGEVASVVMASPVRSTRSATRAGGTGARTQWVVLAQRNLAILRRNYLTLAIMLGAPALVIAMFALLFRPGALDPTQPDATAALSTTYWMTFAAFFFGLTYGLLQICTELPLVRRELFVGVRVSSYLAAKVTVLAPVLMGVTVAMLAVLRGLDRLPDLGAEAYGRLTVTLLLTSLAVNRFFSAFARTRRYYKAIEITDVPPI